MTPSLPVAVKGRGFSASVVVLILALAAYLGARPSVNFLLLPLALAALLFLLRTPQLGPIALLVAAMAIPYTIGTGTQTPLHLAILLIPILLVAWVLDMVRRRSIRLAPSPGNIPAVALVASAVISFLSGNILWSYFAQTATLQAQIGGLAIFALSVGTLLLVGNTFGSIDWLKALTYIFLAMGAGVVIGRLIPPLWPILGHLQVRGADGSLFWIWLVSMSAGQALFNDELNPGWRAGLAVVAAMTLSVGWFLARTWVSGWLPPLVAGMCLLWLRSWRLGLMVTVFGALGVIVFEPGLLGGLLQMKEYSIDTRSAAWQIVLGQIVPLNPIFGLGPANYYRYTSLFSILGWYVNFNSHNQYIDLLAQLGVVGLGAFCWLVFAIWSLGWRLRQQVGTGFAHAYVNGTLAGLAGTLWAGVHGDWFLPFVYNIGLTGFRASILGWLFLGGLVAIGQITRRSTKGTLD